MVGEKILRGFRSLWAKVPQTEDEGRNEDIESMEGTAVTLSVMYNSVVSKLQEVLHGIWNVRRAQKKTDEILGMILQMQRQISEAEGRNSAALEKILLFLQPPPPVRFKIEYIGENAMAKVVKASVDFKLLDNGTATATLTPQDAVGNPTDMPAGASTPAWTSSDPAVVVTAAADGLSVSLSPSGVLATGVIIAASSALADGTTISGQGDPIDVVAGPASSFKIVEQ